MKLSNKLLLAFFSLLFIYLNAAFIEIRLRGTSHILNDENSMVETVNISGFNYLVLPSLDHPIRVVGSDTSRVEVRSTSGDLLKELTYSKSGNVLSLEGFNVNKDQVVRITIYVPDNDLKGMTVDGANVTITGLEQNELNITQTNGWITMRGSNIPGKLHIQSSNAYFEVSESQIDTLSLLLESTRITVLSPVTHLKGSLTGTSDVTVREVEVIEVSKDNGSRLILE